MAVLFLPQKIAAYQGKIARFTVVPLGGGGKILATTEGGCVAIEF
jgi:hypothetical protein